MLNKTTMMGRLTADPELKTTTSGVKVTTFSIAVDRNYLVGDKHPTDFFNVVAWRGTAEFICRNFKKGKPIILEGCLETRSYEAKDGGKRHVTELIVDQVYFAGDSPSKSQPPLPDAPPEQKLAGELQRGGSVPPEAQSHAIDVDFTEMNDSEDLPF